MSGSGVVGDGGAVDEAWASSSCMARVPVGGLSPG